MKFEKLQKKMFINSLKKHWKNRSKIFQIVWSNHGKVL